MALKVLRTNIFVYPYFFGNVYLNDIGLIKLHNRIRFSETVQPAKLPDSCEPHELINVIAVGNGQTNKHKVATNLQYAELRTLSEVDCVKQDPALLLSLATICAESRKNQSICHGDSGSGLIRRKDYVLIGVASWVHETGCDKGQPQGFTDILSYSNWIGEVTGLKLPSC